MNTTLAPSSRWYCAVLLRASRGLERLAHRLDAPLRDNERAPEDLTPLDLLRARERAEEELREIRFRNLRYY